MVFVLLGANYSDVPLEQLESLESHTDQIRKALFETEAGKHSGVVIGTCNRFEVYLDTDDFQSAIDRVIRVVSEVSGLDFDYLSQILQVSYGTTVAQHLYSVASGLESMVIGEGEISGQVKKALQQAQNGGHASSGLNWLFQTASTVAKKVSTDTGLGDAGRSIITTGLQLQEQLTGSLVGASVVLFGTGAYARVALAALERCGVAKVQVYSESGRAQQFCEQRNAHPVERGQLRSALAHANLVVTASGSRSYSLSFHLAKDVLQLQEQLGLPRGIHIVDVALAKSVAPHAYELAGVNIIDLDYIHRHAPREHSQSVLTARQIVLDAVADFEAEQSAKAADPMIARLRQHITGWVDEEVQRVRSRSDQATADEVQRSLQRVANAILHTPSINAKELAKSGNQEEYILAVKTLFGIDLD